MAEKVTQSDEACVDGLRDTADTENVVLESDGDSDMQTGEAGVGESGTDEVDLQSDEATSSVDEEVCTVNIDKAGIHSDEASVEGRETADQTDKVGLQSNEAGIDKRDTADADIILCDPCLEEHDEVVAVGFCVDCNDYLCKDCIKIHKKQKALKCHILKDKNEMPISRPIQNPTQLIGFCSEHKDKKVTLFCRVHKKILCEVCRQVDHRKCENVAALASAIKEYDITEEMQKVKDKVDGLKKEFMKNEIHAKQNKVIVEDYYQAAVRQFSRIRDKDLQLMTSIEETSKFMIGKISQVQDDLEAVRNQTTPAFIELWKAKRSIEETEMRLQSVKSDNKINKYRYSNELLPRYKQEMIGAILKCPSKLKDLYVHKLGDKGNCGITGIEVLPNNRLAVADFSNRKIKLIDLKNGEILSSLDLQATPWGLTKVNDSIVAVSTWEDKLIFLSCLENLIVHIVTFHKYEIKYNEGIEFFDGKLYRACSNPQQILVMNHDGVILNTIKIERDVSIFDITIHSETSSLYLSEMKNNKIHRLNLDGEIQSSYVNEHSKTIRCITMGKDGRLFACLEDPDLIVEMTADLSKCEVVFDHTSGISSPYGIKYNHEDCKLYVGCWDSNIVRVFLV